MLMALKMMNRVIILGELHGIQILLYGTINFLLIPLNYNPNKLQSKRKDRDVISFDRELIDYS